MMGDGEEDVEEEDEDDDDPEVVCPKDDDDEEEDGPNDDVEDFDDSPAAAVGVATFQRLATRIKRPCSVARFNRLLMVVAVTFGCLTVGAGCFLQRRRNLTGTFLHI